MALSSMIRDIVSLTSAPCMAFAFAPRCERLWLQETWVRSAESRATVLERRQCGRHFLQVASTTPVPLASLGRFRGSNRHVMVVIEAILPVIERPL